MAFLNDYESFSTEFLEKHYHIVLFDTFHQITAHLLYPGSQCDDVRANITLTLNVDRFHKLREKNNDPGYVAAIRYFLRIPEDSYFVQYYTQAYPIWLIHENFQKKEQDFKIVDRLIWALLRLVKSYEVSGYPVPYTSINEAINVILGKTPLKTKARELQKEDYLCGEKEYRKKFNTYKSICHYIAALEFIKTEENKNPFCIETPEQVEKILNLAQWFRANLLAIQTPNVKQNTLLTEENLMPLPAWFKSEQINISIEPIEEKLQEIHEQFKASQEEFEQRYRLMNQQ